MIQIILTKPNKADFQKVWEGSKNNIVVGFDIEKGSMDYSQKYLEHWEIKTVPTICTIQWAEQI